MSRNPFGAFSPGPADPDALDLMLECHERIRRFADMAVAVAEAPSSPSAAAVDRAQAAERVARYFGEALPLHVADEDDGLWPRLRGRDPAVDQALVRMHREHGEHRAPLARLVADCRSLATGEGLSAERSQAFSTLAQRLRADFHAHLALEESVIFPAARRELSRDELLALRAEIRARRQAALSSSGAAATQASVFPPSA